MTLEYYYILCEAAISQASKKNMLGMLASLQQAEICRDTLTRKARSRLDLHTTRHYADLWVATVESIKLAMLTGRPAWAPTEKGDPI